MSSTTEPLGQNLIKLISNVCFSFFVFAVLIFTVIAITYQPPDPWLESSKALTRVFSSDENATFRTDDSVLTTGEDLIASPLISPTALPALPPLPASNCSAEVLNCSEPRILATIQHFNLHTFRSIVFLDYQAPVPGPSADECDVAWRFRNRKQRTWRRYRDYRRFKLTVHKNCSVNVVSAGRWHSGKNARIVPRPKGDHGSGRVRVRNRDEDINDTILTVGSEADFRKGRYLYYSRGGDYCKGMNHYIWSFLCGLGEAKYLNRTFVMDLSICLSGSYTSTGNDEEGKDFRFYFDFEHLKETTPIVEEGEFLRDWKNLKKKKSRISVKKVSNHKITPMQLKKEKSTILWRQFEAPEPDNYWYRVCEGPAAKYIQRPWHALWKSKRLMNIVSDISSSMDWDFDAVHVVRGKKAENKEMWPNLDRDTYPDVLVEKLTKILTPWRHLYIATNEPFYNYFDKLRSHFKVHLLEDYKELWANSSEWYNETMALNGGKPVEFDGYMRVEVDTEVLYRAKTRVETFNNLTMDCKDGINTC